MSASVRSALRTVGRVGEPVAKLSAFLCPAISSLARSQTIRRERRIPPRFSHAEQRRCLTTGTTTGPTSGSVPISDPADFTIARVTQPEISRVKILENALKELRTPTEASRAKAIGTGIPQQCSGCGALSQTVERESPGYFSLTSNRVKDYLGGGSSEQASEEDAIVTAALKQAGLAGKDLGDFSRPTKNVGTPLCDRCHYLKNQNTGVSIQHPSMKSIQTTLYESPYKFNHVYHIIDAADFPMSLIPGIHRILHTTPQRSQNRRSKTGKFYHGKKTEVSFIITRADLLAPLKTQVDAMMPYFRAVIRDALGKAGKDTRLGNVRCVSSNQAWWTKELKEEIWTRGGGGWLVGKVNVGKSRLFQEVFPKGRKERERFHGKGVSKMPQATLNYLKKDAEEPLSTDSEAAAENKETHLEVESNITSEQSLGEFEDTASAKIPEKTEQKFDSTTLMETSIPRSEVNGSGGAVEAAVCATSEDGPSKQFFTEPALILPETIAKIKVAADVTSGEEVSLPAASTEEAIVKAIPEEDAKAQSAPGQDTVAEAKAAMDEFEGINDHSPDNSSLLTPAPPEVEYPEMPLVSALPGTTASPIRLSFGGGKGELIDLPGLSRGDLELHVEPEFRSQLVMRNRVQPEQKSIKEGKSILLGGFIRITPTNMDDVILSYAFTPIKAHLTSTEKAIGTQMRTRESHVQNISVLGIEDTITSAGTFHLKYDVTRQRTGPITRSDAVDINPARLPYKMMATDILIEGCGWVELVARISKTPEEKEAARAASFKAAEARIEESQDFDDARELEQPKDQEIDPRWPAVEVFTPGGKFVAARRPMNAWILTQGKPVKNKLQGRPRRSMKGMAKLSKSRAKRTAWPAKPTSI